MTDLALYLLGGFRLTRRGQEIFKLPRRGQLLLAYLAVARRKQERRDTLATLLWQDSETDRARANLRQLLSRLRKITGTPDEGIWADNENIGLRESAWQIDVDTLVKAASSRAELDESVFEYVGVFAQGISARESAIEQWVEGERRRFRELALELLSRGTAEAVQTSNPTQVVRLSLKALTLDPYRESVHRDLMRAYALQGDSSRALRHFHSLRRKLDEELGVPPDSETLETVEQLRLGRRVTTAKPDTAATSVQWDDDYDLSEFSGRERELAQLDDWILKQRGKLIVVQGMGGMGKTTLAMKFAKDHQHEFDAVCWKSLRNAPSLASLLAEVMPVLSGQSDSVAELTRLQHWLKTRRCLLVLDNLESILQPQDHSGTYLPGFETYAQLLNLAGSGNHASCLLTTTREQPAEFAALDNKRQGVRTLHLQGSLEIARSLKLARGFTWHDDALVQLHNRYGGNPLALKIVMTAIQELYHADIEQFFADDVTLFNSIRRLLEVQIERLSDPEQSILYWLALNRDWTDLKTLTRDLNSPIPPHVVLESLESLHRRSLIEVSKGQYRLQPVVLEFVVSVLVETFVEEFIEHKPRLLSSHAMTNCNLKEYVYEAQLRMVSRPVIEQLKRRIGELAENQDFIEPLLQSLSESSSTRTGYAAGNVLNLLLESKAELLTCEFSALTLRRVDFRNRVCRGADFRDASFVDSEFTQAFGSVLMLAFSIDGALFATSHTSLDVFIWRTGDLQPITRLKHLDWVRAIQFSPDSSLIATGTDDFALQLWEVRSGRLLHVFENPGGRVAAVHFHADQRSLLAATEDGVVRCWDTDSGSYVSEFDGGCEQLWSLSASPDGDRLAICGADPRPRIWDADGRVCLLTLEGHTDQVPCIRYSPDGALLASCSHDGTVRLWENETGVCVATFAGHDHWVLAVSFDRHGRLLASAGEDGQIRIWDIAGRQCIRVIQNHLHRVRSIAFSPCSDELLSGSEDQSVRFWDCTPLDTKEAAMRISGHCLNIIRGHTRAIWSVDISPDETRLVTSGDEGAVRVWEIESGACMAALRGHALRVRTACWSPDGTLIASASEDQTARVWRASTGECIHILRAHDKQVWDVAFCPDGEHLATGSEDHTIRIWNVASGNCLRVLEGHEHWVWDLAFSHDAALLASAGFDGMIKLWDWHSGDCVRTLAAHQAPVMGVDFNNDGSLLASTSVYEGSVRIWNCHTGEEVARVPGQAAACVQFAPPSSASTSREIFATGGRQGAVKLHALGDTVDVKLLAGHDPESLVWSVDFSSSGRWLVSGCMDQSARLWDLKSLECVRIFRCSKPYEGCRIDGVKGLTDAQIDNLVALGALIDGRV